MTHLHDARRLEPISDPRYTVIAGALMGAEGGHYVGVSEVLELLDAADRAAGIVRVDTNDEALVERLREAIMAALTDNCMVEPGASQHGWRCEHPDRYGPCDCTAIAVADIIDAILAALRDAQ